MVIRVESLEKTFRPAGRPAVPVLKGVSVHVEKGQMLCLVGPNGIGKTTLLKILATLVLPDGGVAEIDGWDVAIHPREVRRRVGWIGPEEKGFYPQLTVEENLFFFAALFGIGPFTCRRRVEELALRWNWSLPRRQPYQELSSGNKRRLALLRALLHDPAVLLLDEPTGHLDPQASQGFREDFRKHSAAADHRAAIWVTQDLTEAWKLSCPIAVLARGRLNRLPPLQRLEDLEAAYGASFHPEGGA